MQVSTQDSQRNVPLQPQFAAVTATLKSIAGLKRTNGRLNSRVTFA